MNLDREILERIETLREYDVRNMERVVAICCWGRSGSLLLSSYFDSHPEVLALPSVCGQHLFKFYERYPTLSLRERLLGYPAFEQLHAPFFEGDFAVSATQYYAAVLAISTAYEGLSEEFLDSRRAFFLFVHIAYNMALGRRSATATPLIVYAQHERSNERASQLVHDFPEAKFLHIVRDPISVFDREFDQWLGANADRLPPTEPLRDPKETRPLAWNTFSTVAPWNAFNCLVNKDCFHTGMESRTRTVRFEDLHNDPEAIMRALADWLGVAYDARLVDSTFNGRPYVVSRGGKKWSGRREAQAKRHDPVHVYRKDQGLMYALFYEDFDSWGYEHPKVFRNRIVRCLVFVPILILPTKMEVILLRSLVKRRILPALRHGKLAIVGHSVVRILFCRIGTIWLLLPMFTRRIRGKLNLLKIDPGLPSVAAHH